MSRIAPVHPEEVEPEARRAMTPARMARIHEREKGICWLCTKEVPERGPDVRYDHKLPLEIGGTDDDANIFPIHREPCDRIKTAADRQRIDKARRLRKKRLGLTPAKRAWPSRGFQKGKRPWGK